jgi:hypothetical protein
MARRIGAALVCAALASGCVYNRTSSDTNRTATEQLLVSHSIEQAVAELALPPLGERRVAVSVESVPAADTGYLRGLLEARLGSEGARLVPSAEAEVRVVALIGAIGTASRKGSFGLPSIPLPTLGVTPEVPFISSARQSAWTRLQVTVWEADGVQLARSPSVQVESHYNVTSVLFLEVRSTDIYPGENGGLALE